MLTGRVKTFKQGSGTGEAAKITFNVDDSTFAAESTNGNAARMTFLPKVYSGAR